MFVPIFLIQHCSLYFHDRDLIEHYCRLIDEHGTDFWWKLSDKELLPSNITLPDSNSLIKGKVSAYAKISMYKSSETIIE